MSPSVSAAAIVLAKPLDSYPPLRLLPEPLPVVRVEACACGERIRQLAGERSDNTLSRHQATLLHASWRRRSGL